MKPFSLQWIISDQEAGVIIRDFLKEKAISRQALTDIKYKGGSITVNGQPLTVRYRLQANDILVVTFPKEAANEEMIVEYQPFDIVYEDESILLINKEAGIPSIPSREHPCGTLANRLLGYYEKIGLQSTVHIINRLDKDTSGLMLVAKNRYVHHLFSMQQQVKEIKRTYVALVHGTILEEGGTIDAPIGRKETSIIEREVRQDGQHAVTHYKVLQCLADMTLVKLQLETGRTHQIRVHMAYRGYPLVGDDLYGGKVDILNRQALHSQAIDFYHPILQTRLSFFIPLASDMNEVISKRS
ncbi:MAG: RluA family pseudouridine synthase [Bacillaceae bacterium]